jgi:hypothetical protein
MMNEKIKELLAQCSTESIDGPEYNDWVDQEKFARLIIQGCLDQVLKIRDNAGSSHKDKEIILSTIRSTCLVAHKQIKNHFGMNDE